MKVRLTLSVGLAVLAAIATGVAAPNAAANHVGNPEVGLFDQANVTCTSAAWSFSSTGTIKMSPQVGASTRYTEQTVAWQFYIRNEATGQGAFVSPGWKSARHYRVQYDYVFDPFSPTGTRLQRFESPMLPNPEESTAYRAPGRYIVFTQYAWLTSTGWVYSDWVKNTSYVQNGVSSLSCQM